MLLYIKKIVVNLYSQYKYNKHQFKTKQHELHIKIKQHLFYRNKKQR
jgi:hypothetical protein